MDSKPHCELNMVSEPPAYKFIPTVPKNRQQLILISLVLVLLAIIIIGAILIGVYVTQQHTEMVIIQTVNNGSDGKVVQQTVMVNNQESVVAFYIQSNTTSATVVYDYKHHLIGFRIHERSQCSVVRMDSVAVPSLGEITKEIEHSDELISNDDSLAYSFKQGKLANRTILGTTMNILCSDVPVYWTEIVPEVSKEPSSPIGSYLFTQSIIRSPTRDAPCLERLGR